MGALLCLTSVAQADDNLPPLQTQSDIEWMSGGIGQDEVQAMKREAPRWPLALSFALADKDKAIYTADVEVSIKNAAHYEIFKARSNGPFMLVRLKPGRYTLDASLNGHAQQRRISITAQSSAPITLVWPLDAQPSGD